MTANRRGRFITLEGIDGAGKSTHLQAIADWLLARGITVVQTREPGGTPLAETLREAVLQREMDVLTEALLVFAARRDHVVQRIEPALAGGQWVLCDRFTDASFAYQGGGHALPLEVLNALERWVHGALQPDLTLWFDIAPEVAAARRAQARAADRFERQDTAFYVRVREAYRQRMVAMPQRFACIDASPEPAAVWQQIATALQRQPWP